MAAPSRVVAVMAAGALAFAGWLTWRVHADERTPFLTTQPGADWILYPVPPQNDLQTAVEQEAVFERRFELERVPRRAELTARFFRAGEVTLNGVPVALAHEGDSWKEGRHAEVAAMLRTGENHIEVRVRYDRGPPALWLRIDSEDGSIGTNSEWRTSLMGAVERPARRAVEPMSQWSSLELVAPVDTTTALRSAWPRIAVTALVVALLLAALRRAPAEFWRSRGASIALVALVALLWAALTWNNAPLLFRLAGFDASGHIAYVAYVQENGALPLADEGWQMYQPPLYYALAAGLLDLAGHEAADPRGAALIRWLMVGAAALQAAAVLGSLRLLFPEGARGTLYGLALATLLPAQLYTFQYVTNEGLAAVLVSTAVWACLLALRPDRTSVALHALLGLCLGAAMLTKFSALLAFPAVGVALAMRVRARAEGGAAPWLRSVGAVTAGIALVCGWHYARVWSHFGTPLVGNWSPGVPFAWWQAPGYRTSSYYYGFGLALTEPVFSGYRSFLDAIYSTLWGDGLFGGRADVRWMPPWDLDRMGAGYLLALLPTIAVALGGLVALRRFVRAPTPEWALVLILGATVPAAVLAMTIELPYYAQARAIYGLSAVVPLAALGVLGLRWMGSGHRFAAFALAALFGTFAANAYATFWGDRTSERNAASLALAVWEDGRPERARELFEKVLTGNRSDARAWVGLARIHLDQGRVAEARTAAAAALAAEPGMAEGHVQLGLALHAAGQLEAAVASLRRAVELAPDHPTAYANLGLFLVAAGDDARARIAYREALRVAPLNAQCHLDLARIELRAGRAVQAEEALRRVLLVLSDQLEARMELTDLLEAAGRDSEAVTVLRAGREQRQSRATCTLRLAQLLATSPDDSVRNGAEAVRLADEVARAHGNAGFLTRQVLAAAYAEVGSFDDAVRLQGELARELGSAATGPTADEVRRRLAAYRAGRPWRRE